MRKFLYIVIILFFSLNISSQNNSYQRYIQKYQQMAMEQMVRYKIPASITLAQGLLESGAGNSQLARKANNHFGIKCGGRWNGPYMLMDDDARNEHFRVYKSPEESFEDHSKFLCSGKRYAGLFQLSILDYKGWAKGLKAAGYATNPRYADNLINIIENYNLNDIDLYVVTGNVSSRKLKQNIKNGLISGHRIMMNNKNFYTIARKGDTYKSIGKEMGVSARRLRKYNEVPKDYEVQEGDIVYFEKKQRKADKQYKGKYIIITSGESIYSISQKFGMRIKTLYKLNNLPDDYSARIGDKLRIR